MRTIFTFLTLLIFNFFPVMSQELSSTLTSEGFPGKAHQEKVFVHHNSAVIFPGEYFFYSVYNLDSRTGKLSNLSKIAYVELLGEKGNMVFRQKIKLEKGQGNADFFIPTSVPSGSYKLLAYTNWMRNVEGNFFESDITLVNPYQSIQRGMLEETMGFYVENDRLKDEAEINSKNSLVSLKIDKNTFQNREEVKLDINSKIQETLGGSYSVSVRKIESLPFYNSPSAITVTPTSGSASAFNAEMLRLPELRGQLISGKLTSETGSSLGNKVISLSIPSEGGFAQLVTTNEKGQFFFNLETDVRNSNAVLEVISNDLTEFRIEPDKNEGIDPSSLNFTQFTLSPEMKDVILQRSIYNQIENAFFAVKPDTLVPPQNELPLPTSITETYVLDEYTRFKSMPETFVEIIKSAWVRKNSAGDAVFQVRGLMNYADMGFLPLVMIDGILIQDHNIPATMDARRIKSINIIRDKIFLGPASFQGAILFETINGDFFEQYAAPNIKRIELFNPQAPKKYFRQVYTDETRNNRIPDFRYQLHWEPKLEIESKNESITFFTSDVDGNFEIILEGFTVNGKAVSIREQFRVE